MDIKDKAARYIQDLSRTMAGFDYEAFSRVAELLIEAHAKELRVFVMGNGGSGASASHFACDINKGCCFDLEKRFKVICLNDNVPTMMAYSNDLCFEDVFVEQLKNFFQPGDLVIGISGSGNSENVLRAIRYANENDGTSIGLCGFSGGKLAKIVDVPFIAKIDDMQKVEDLHVIFLHMLMQVLYERLHS